MVGSHQGIGAPGLGVGGPGIGSLGIASLAMASLGIAVGMTGCVTETTVRPPRGPYEVKELEKWRVMHQGEQIGRLVLLQIRVESDPLSYFRAETIGGQWVGYVARDGRFFKNEPFRAIELGPRDLGLYPMNQGLGLLYEVEGLITVVPMHGRGEPTEAAAHHLFRKALEKHHR